jgi:hypothetical protein
VSKAKLLKMAKFSAGKSAFAQLMGREQIALLSALRLGRWELNGFLHKIQLVASAACPDPGCLVDETHEHVLMECPRFSAERLILKQRLQSRFGIDLSIRIVLGGVEHLKDEKRKPVLQIVNDFIRSVCRSRF